MSPRTLNQYSASNAWNVNFNNANVNNNTKSNSNYVRACSDYTEEPRFPPVSLESVIEADLDCRRHKRNTVNEQLWELDAVKNDVRLWRELQSGTYEIGYSIVFLVKYPVLREVFAGAYKDRVVHHWIYLRLNPLFEKYLYPFMMSNRKGRGTLAAVMKTYSDINAVSDKNANDCHIYKFDFKGFFMSIDKRILNTKLQAFIDERYEGCDKDALKWLVEKVVMHCPQERCRYKSPKEMWAGLSPSKSLFGQDRYHELAIGNLTSQIFANFYLRDAMTFLLDNGMNHLSQYVDDVVAVVQDKKTLFDVIPKFRRYLKEELNIELHRKKSYIQHYTKGVSFVGAVIRKDRIYPSRRMRHNMLRLAESKKKNIWNSMQSYLGLSSRFSAYKLRLTMVHSVAVKTGMNVKVNKYCLVAKFLI